MAINAVPSTSTTVTTRPAASGPMAALQNLLPAQMDGDTLALGVRVSQPAVKLAADHMGWLKNLFHHGGNTPVPPAPNPNSMVFGSGRELGGVTGGAASGASNILKTFGAALKSNFLVSAVVAAVSDGIGLVTGKLSAKRALTSFGVDTLAYTGIGATATTIGATLGTLIPIPFVGTLLGVAAGFGIGLLYEKLARKPLIDAAEQAVFSTTA